MKKIGLTLNLLLMYWSDDFSNYIYKHRVFYQKSVPLEKNSKENDWRLGSDQTLLEEHGILAGPRWTTMGSFHNLYLASNYGDIIARPISQDRW